MSCHNLQDVREFTDYPADPRICMQLLTDRSIDEVSTHRRAEALYEIAEIFSVSLCSMLAYILNRNADSF
jgi:hypothetical protein